MNTTDQQEDPPRSEEDREKQASPESGTGDAPPSDHVSEPAADPAGSQPGAPNAEPGAAAGTSDPGDPAENGTEEADAEGPGDARKVKTAELPPIDLTGIDRKSLLQAFLFLEDKPVSVDKLSEMLQSETREVRRLADELRTELERSGSGLQVNEIANGYILSTKASLGNVLKQFYNRKNRPSFSKAAVEVLAIIAYKQPVTRLEVEEIRGAGIGNSLKILLERKLIRIAGRKDVLGHPLLYGTTREFLLYFGLKNLDSLPTIKEIREMEIQ